MTSTAEPSAGGPDGDDPVVLARYERLAPLGAWLAVYTLPTALLGALLAATTLGAFERLGEALAQRHPLGEWAVAGTVLGLLLLVPQGIWLGPALLRRRFGRVTRTADALRFYAFPRLSDRYLTVPLASVQGFSTTPRGLLIDAGRDWLTRLRLPYFVPAEEAERDALIALLTRRRGE